MYTTGILVLSFTIIFSQGSKLSSRVSENLNLPIPPEQPFFPEELNSTNCGDLLIANGGFISYKHKSNYTNNERCIWTIRTPKWQTSFLMHSSGFHSENDHLEAYVMNDTGLLEKKATIDTKVGSKIVGVIGPTVFLVFTTDKVGIGNGFLLEYFGFGYNEISGYEYDHSHSIVPSGSITWPQNPIDHPTNVFSTFTLMPSTSIDAADTFTISVEKVDLISLTKACHHNYLSVHQLFQNGFSMRLRYCEADLLTSAKIRSTSPLLIVYASTIASTQAGTVSFSWSNKQK